MFHIGTCVHGSFCLFRGSFRRAGTFFRRARRIARNTARAGFGRWRPFFVTLTEQWQEMIEVEGITKYYGSIAALREVSFSVSAGEIIGFLGPNGAGKSTAMRILTGFTPATRGRATVAGHEVHEEPLEVKRRVGYLPERVPLYEEMVVSGFLRFVAEVKGVPRKQRAGEVDRILERCGLTGISKRLIRNLSKGYRQRVGLGQALIGAPQVLILDEPTVGLDPKQIVEIRQMIKELGREHTVLLSTHILPEVSMVCERVVIINQGRIVAQERLDQLRDGGRTLEDIFMTAISGDRAPAGEEA